MLEIYAVFTQTDFSMEEEEKKKRERERYRKIEGDRNK